MRDGTTLNISLPAPDKNHQISVSLIGLLRSLDWIDGRQNRQGTTSAIVDPGDEVPEDAPHADPIITPVTLSPAVLQAWDASQACSTIDPAIFASLDAVSMKVDNNSTLYLLPCGTPSAYNPAYVAIQMMDGGRARMLNMAQMTDSGPIAIGIVYNAKWNPKEKELTSLFKGSGLGECGKWNRWKWSASSFVLLEEASRPTCDGEEITVGDWEATWPYVALRN